jgi:riboflavin synthase
MFSGIIAAVGQIVESTSTKAGARLVVESGGLGLGDVALGDSIACSGVCLTVIEVRGNQFVVDVSQETINCTNGLQGLGEINLEKALQVSDRLGGHIVTGHVDGVGEVLTFESVGTGADVCYKLDIRAPGTIAKYIARKGSITVDGVSLTTNTVENNDFSINLIPHTLEQTTLKYLKAGSKVNLEIDLIARYVERINAYTTQEKVLC